MSFFFVVLHTAATGGGRGGVGWERVGGWEVVDFGLVGSPLLWALQMLRLL